jgi:hypothetical protein
MLPREPDGIGQDRYITGQALIYAPPMSVENTNSLCAKVP